MDRSYAKKAKINQCLNCGAKKVDEATVLIYPTDDRFDFCAGAVTLSLQPLIRPHWVAEKEGKACE